ncbi:MAG: tetratricopeptide repeat protein [Myxococcota bacterium]
MQRAARSSLVVGAVLVSALVACTPQKAPPPEPAPPAAAPAEVVKEAAPEGGPEAEVDNACAQIEADAKKLWSTEHQEALHPSLRTRVAPTLEAYATQVREGRLDACEATHVRAEQSPHVMTLRQSCYQRCAAELRTLSARLSDDPAARARANALLAVHRLSRPDDCTDIETLSSGPEIPKDLAEAAAATRAELAAVRVDLSLGDTSAALKAAQTAYDTAPTDYQPVVAEARHLLGLAQVHAGSADAGVDNLQEAAWLAASVKHDAEAARASVALVSAVGLVQRRSRDGLGWGRHAQAALKRIGGGHRREAADLNLALGHIQLLVGEYELAHDHLAKTVAVYGTHTPDEARSIRMRGEVALKQGKLGEAQKHFDEARTWYVDLLGSEHPRVAEVMTALARLEAARGDVATSIRKLDEAAKLVEAALGPSAVELADVDLARAEILERHGDPKDAVAALDRASATRSSALGDAHPDTQAALVALGRAQLKHGDPDAARKSLERVTSASGDPSVTIAEALVALSGIERTAGNLDEARHALRRVTSTRAMPKHLVGEAKLALADVELTSDKARAIKLAKEAAAAFKSAGDEAGIAAAAKWVEAHGR